MSFPAHQRVNVEAELASEFYTVVMQVKAGQDRSKAFQQLVRRTGIEDIKSLSAMIVQSERFGTSLSQALKVYADWLKIPEAKAQRTRDDFFPRPSVEPDRITGLDTIVKDAAALKFTATELTKAQLDDLIQIPPR